jgi:hypothetical protein
MPKCIYCFKEFDPLKVHFRALGPIIEKSELEKVASPGEDAISYLLQKMPNTNVVDDKLKEYFMAYKNMDVLTATRAATTTLAFDPGTYKHGVEIDIQEADGISYAKKIDFDTTVFCATRTSTHKCLCPHCHNTLPEEFGTRATVLLSIIGDSHSGKSVYIATLLNLLMKNELREFRSSIREVCEDRSQYTRIDGDIIRIFDKRELPEATDPNIDIPPIVYRLTYTYKDYEVPSRPTDVPREIDLVIYDIAGEICSDPVKLNEKGKNIIHSDGLIVLLNPMTLNVYSNHLKASNPTAFRASTPTMADVDDGGMNIMWVIKMFGALGMLLAKADDTNFAQMVPTAIVVSKSDLLTGEGTRHADHYSKYKDTPIYGNNGSYTSAHMGYLDRDDIGSLNLWVRRLVDTFSVGVLNTVDNMFPNASFFLSSALNQIPEPVLDDAGEVVGSRLEKNINPYRVMDPLLWILAKKGLLTFCSNPDKQRKKRKWGFH